MYSGVIVEVLCYRLLRHMMSAYYYMYIMVLFSFLTNEKALKCKPSAHLI